MRAALLSLALSLTACASSPPLDAALDGLPETSPAPPGSDDDALLAAALRYALESPESDYAPLVAGRRVPVASEYHVREGDGWPAHPLTAAALPAGTGRAFVLVSDEEACGRAREHEGFSRVTLGLERVAADTALVRIGGWGLYPSAVSDSVLARPRQCPGYVGAGGSPIGRFVRSGRSWAFDEWVGWIGS